jgi:predicted Zn-dependent protease with MMP-like domain
MSLRSRRRDYHRRLGSQPALTPEEFDTLTREALDLLPAWAAPYLERVALVVEDEPPADEDPDLLGLYVGSTIFGETDIISPGGLPDVIQIFQGPHERQFRGRRELRREVAETVLHEIAHHFGIEEETLDEIGPIDVDGE